MLESVSSSVKRIHQIRVATTLALIWATVISLVYILGIFNGLEEIIIDQLQLLPAPEKASIDLALIDIHHIPSDRPWPWSRLDYALILQGLRPQHVQSVVFEMLLHDTDARYSAFDTSFADQISQANKVLFSAAALRPDDASPPPSGITPIRTKGDFRSLIPYGSFFWPVETFSTAGKVGIGNLSSENSRNLRTVELVFRYREQIIPSLSLWAAALRLGADMSRTTVDLGHEVVLYDEGNKILSRIPIDQRGLLHLRYRRPEMTMPRISSDQLLLSADQADRGASVQVDLKPLTHRQVWVGVTDENVAPFLTTVNGPMAPVSIQMQATRQILSSDYLRPIPWPFCIVFFLVSGVLLSRNFITKGKRFGLLTLTIFVLIIFTLSAASFQLANICFPMATTAIYLLGIIVCGMAARNWEMGGSHVSNPL